MDHDAQLIRRFAEEGSETAFTELVQRHIDLVYGAALRRMGGDAHRAADVTQQVFVGLARQAPRLVHHTALSAWLHSATRNLAINLMVAEQRRRVRETAAAAVAATGEAGAFASWDDIRPVLDAAIDELPEADRTAVVLRFLEQRPFAEVGALLDVSADAARMRTERALEKLRAVFARRGITSSSAALGTLISGHATGAAPAGLAAGIAPAAIAAISGGAAAAATFFVSTKSIVAAASVVAALGLGLLVGAQYSAQEPLPPLPATSNHLQTIAALRKENQQLKADADRLAAANTALQASVAPKATAATTAPAPSSRPAATASTSDPVPAMTRANQQRAIINNLRMISAARAQFFLAHKRAPASLDEIVGPDKYIRALTPAAGESYDLVALSDSHLPLTVTGPDGTPLTYDPKGPNTTDLRASNRAAQEEVQRVLTERFGAEFIARVQGSIEKAVTAYAAANGGKSPPNATAALPYFATPQEGADFVEFSEAAKALGTKL